MQRWRLAVLLAAAWTTEAAAENWPGWRGPTGDGVSRETNLPLHWSRDKNVVWEVETPGLGHSSPIVWDDKVILTASTGPLKDTRWWVLAYNRADGKLLWKVQAVQGEGERFHNKHGHASSTPLTDGKHIWCYFGNGGLVCLDMTGRIVWKKSLRTYQNPWGSAASVVALGDRLILNGDDDVDPFLIALDKNTGEERWRTPRTGQMRSFSTPAFVKASGDRTEIVVNGYKRAKAYDAETGKELWTVEGAMDWVTPTPVTGGGLVFASSGRNGPTFAIRPGGQGDVTKSHVAWKVPTGSPYISSPVLWEKYLFMVNGTGVSQCIDVETGKVLWKQRIGITSEGFSNSPIAAEGRFYVMDEEGTCTVLAADAKYKVLAKNKLDERCLTSPAVSDGQLFLRTDRHLFCIGNGK